MNPTIEINGIECYGEMTPYTESVVIISELPDGTEVVYDADNLSFWVSWEECIESLEDDFECQQLTISAVYTPDVL